MDGQEKPRGREEVRAAILDAAAKLFSKHGVAAVSVRDIADQANVNHGLIHRHFGSKENLRREVQDSLAAQVRAEVGNPDDLEDALWRATKAVRKHEAFWRVLARTLLDGQFKGDVQSDYPFVYETVELVREAQKKGIMHSDIDPRLVVAGCLALSLGLLVFEQYILPGTGLDGEPKPEIDDKILAAWLALLKR